jgi:hypothetical protein
MDHPLEQLWPLLHAGDVAGTSALFDGESRRWDDPIFDGSENAAIAGIAIPRFAAWLRERAASGPSTIAHFRTLADERRVAVESVLRLRNGLTWNQAAQKADPAAEFELPVAVVGDRAAGRADRYRAIRIYFGTWSVLDGKPKLRLGPIAPDERAATRATIDTMPTIARYFECLAAGSPEIIEQFETDGYFREPANNYCCGRLQLEEHFSHILKLGGVGVEFLTAIKNGQRIACEVQTIQWGPKKMAQPQAGYASYELGPHGRIAGSRVYDSVVPPEL